MANILVTALNAGELSPYMDARVDVEKYKSGCRRLENMVVLPYGGVYRRPGTEYLGAAKHQNKKCRLIGFNFSVNTRFVLEFGDSYLRIWGNDGPVIKDGSPLEIASPYTEAELREVQFVQVNDLMYLAHANHPPQKLSRLADDNWTLAPVVWKFPPVLDQNITATTIAASAATGTVTLTASAPMFLAGHVGTKWSIQWPRNTASVSQAISAANGTSDTLDISGTWTVTTVGTWQARIRLLRIPTEAMNTNGGSGFTDFETVREFRSEDTARNFTATGVEDDRVGMKLQVSDHVSSSNAKAFLESTDFNSGGTFTITAVASGGLTATATVDRWFGSVITATKQWSEAAFSSIRGYPRAVCIHEQRLCFGGTSHQPNTVWCSRTDDFENFQLGAKEDNAIAITVASSEGNRIAWMFSQKRLMIGTSGDEWTIGGSDTSEAFTSTNVQASRQAAFGSKTRRAIMLNDVLLFLQRRGRKIRELTYNFERDGWVAPDLTVLAEHITEGEIEEMAFQQQPDAILWAVRGDGQLVGMSYERDQNVVAWHRHTTQGAFESVCTVYGRAGEDDQVWFVVNRTLNGQTVRCIERFRPDARNTYEDEDQHNWWYLDCAGRYSGASATTITGLSHLDGQTVGILADGGERPSLPVAGGAVTLDRAATTVLAGLPFTSMAQPMKFELEFQDGTTRGRHKRINRVTACVYKSLGGQASTDGVEWEWIYPRTFTDAMDVPPAPFTGDREIILAGDYSLAGDLYVRQQQPYPLTIRALVAKLDAFGD